MSLNTNTRNASKASYLNSKSKNRDLKCKYCLYKGHKEAACYKKYSNLRKDKDNNYSSNNKIINNTSIEEEQVLATSTSALNNYSNNTVDFILDSGATIHTCYIKELFTSIKPTTISIKQGNTNNSIKATGIGDVSLVFTSTNKLVKLTNVLFIQELGFNLLSLNLITSKGFNLLFNKDSCYITIIENNLLAKGSYKKGVSYFTASSNKVIPTNYRNKELTVLNSIEEEEQDITVERYRDIRNTSSNSNNNSNKETIAVNNNTIDLAHRRLGHINLSAIRKL